MGVRHKLYYLFESRQEQVLVLGRLALLVGYSLVSYNFLFIPDIFDDVSIGQWLN